MKPLLLLAMIGLLRLPPARAEPPWSVDERHPVVNEAHRPASEAPAMARAPFSTALFFYGRYLTRVDGPRCAHTPTCAVFAGQALARFGPLPGLWMALDRILHGARSSAIRLLAVDVQGRFVDRLADHRL